MTTISPNAPHSATGGLARLARGLTGPWRNAADVRDEAYVSGGDARLAQLMVAGVALLGVLGGAAVAFAGVNGLYLCVALIGCAFVLLDFRIGVVLLVLLMPISSSYVFPRAMFGVTGANPVNLLIVATLGSWVLQAVTAGGFRRFLPAPLLWLYIVPIVIAGLLGSRHVAEIAPVFYLGDSPLDFHNAVGYLRDTVFKPLLMVVFALLIGVAAAKSEKPEKFLAPMLISIWAVCGIVILYVAAAGVGLGELAASTSREFLSGTGMHANELGRLYAVAYALLLFTWAESKEPGLRFVLLASMALVAMALVLTFSRSAFVGFILVNALYVLWRLDARTLIFALLLLAGALILPAAVYERAATGFGEGLNAVTAGRVDGLWLPLLPEVLKSPLWGSGHYSILWSEAMHRGGGATVLLTTHPHNAYLQALLDMGIAGLVLFCAYFAHVWKRFRALGADAGLSPTLRGFYQGAAAGLLSLLILGLADGSLVPRTEHAYLWFAIGMMYGQRARNPAT
jgi:O-antigen ligase